MGWFRSSQDGQIRDMSHVNYSFIQPISATRTLGMCLLWRYCAAGEIMAFYILRDQTKRVKFYLHNTVSRLKSLV